MIQLSFRLFIFLLIFSPLAFGTVEPWSLGLMETTVFAGLLLYLFALAARRERPYRVPGLTPLLLLLAYTALQCIPLPAGLVRFVSPGTYDLYAATAGILGPVDWLPIAIHQKKTLAEFFRFSASVGFYYLTVQLLSDRERLKKTVFIVIIFAALMAILALIQKMLSPDMIYGFRRLPANATPMGPYVYHNAFAGFMEMVLPLVLCLFFYYRPRIDTKKTWRQRLVDFLGQHRTNTHVLLGFAAILMATSVFVSLSRGGIISLGLSTIFLLFFMLKKGIQKSSGVLALFVFLVTILGVGWFGWDAVFERFTGLRNLEGAIHNERLVYWQDSNEILADFPLTGTGFGTFRDIYPAYRTAPGQAVVEHAHNDYIELLTDGGIIAFLLAGWFLTGLLYWSFRAYSRRKERYSIYLFIGSLTGIAALLVHSITDFNFQIGANGLYFFFLAGLLVSAANTRMRSGLQGTMLKRTDSGVHIFSLPGVTAILVFCLVFSTGSIMAGLSFLPVKDRVLNDTVKEEELAAMKDLAQKASFLDPLEARYRFALANVEAFLGKNREAVRHYQQAVRRHPTDSELLQTSGLFLAGLGDRRAGDFLRAATRHDGNNPERIRRYATWLLAAGQREEGLVTMQRAMAMEPWKTNAYISLLVLYRLSDEEIRRALPDMMPPHLIFADYLRDTGQDAMAERAYSDALRFMKQGEKNQPPWVFQKVAGFYSSRKRYDAALAVIREAMELLPADAGLKVTAGSLHERLGNTSSAAQEYRKALVLDPENKKAQKHLARLEAKKGKAEK